MKYTEEEIVAHARSQIRFVDQQKGRRLARGIAGIAVIAMFILLIQMIDEKSERIGTNLLLDEKFLSGIAMGILIVMGLAGAVLNIIPMLAGFRGKEIGMCRLLVRLNDERKEG